MNEFDFAISWHLQQNLQTREGQKVIMEYFIVNSPFSPLYIGSTICLLKFAKLQATSQNNVVF